MRLPTIRLDGRTATVLISETVAIEVALPIPEIPTLFAKFYPTPINPYDDIVPSSVIDRWDWEGELAVVPGSHARNFSADQAAAASAGHWVANDISARDWQTRTPKCLQGKTTGIGDGR
ncbi:fumarylacetoacetate hydrolase family protein [Mycolicibacterium sp. CBM1]